MADIELTNIEGESISLGTPDTVQMTIAPVSQPNIVLSGGLTGPQGLPGPKGDTGPTGPAGPQGEIGATGPTGATGPQGEIGPAGPKGDTGATGPQGEQGIQGVKGDTGAIGPAGADGESAYEVAVANGYVGTETEWLASLVGPKGDTGATGPKGDTGATGPQGIQGIQGEQGPQGPAGADGVVQSIVAGANVTIDSTDPANPVVSASGGGGGAVDSVNGQTGAVVLTQDNVADGTSYVQYPATDKSKLAGIAAGAEVNVQADWNATTGDAAILNKPTLGTAAATDSSAYATAVQGSKADNAVQSVVAGSNVTVDSSDPNNPVVSASAAPVSDASTTTKGIVKLAGDLGGTADAPTVPGLAGKVDAAGAAAAAPVQSVAGMTGDVTIGASNLSATGITTTKYLRGDNTWQTPPNTTYAVPSQSEAEAGTATTARAFSAQRVNQAIQALAPVKLTDLAGKVDTTTTVNGHALSSNVTVSKSDVGLGNVDNTADLDKPMSTATKTYVDDVAAGGSVSIISKETPSGVVDGTNTSFTTVRSYVGGSLQVYINGLAQSSLTLETDPSAGAFTLQSPPLLGDDISVSYQYATATTDNANTLDGYTLSGVLEALYPIGSVFTSGSSTMPALIASIGTWVRLNGVVIVGVDDTQTEFNVVNKTGGEASHTLTVGELPSDSPMKDATPKYALLRWDGSTTWGMTSTGSYGSTGLDTFMTAFNTHWNGGGQAHNNLQPYKTKYMWERTA